MPYTGSGANKVPLGKINPILLGQKKDSGGSSSAPSLLSQHLSRRRDVEPGSQAFQGAGQRDGPWNSAQESYSQPGSYNQPGGYSQQGNFTKQGNFNQKNYNYGNQSGNYGDSRQQSSGYDNRQMNSPGSAPPRPLMSLAEPPAPTGPYNQGQGFASGGMNYQNNPQNYGMPPMPPPAHNFNQQTQGYPGQPGGFNAPLPPMPITNSFNPPPPPPNYGGPPLPIGGGKPGMDAPPPPLPPSKFSDMPMVRMSDMSRPKSPPKKRKRRSRWGDEEERTNIPGMPASLPSNITPEQKEQYLMHFKIEEISIKLRSGDLGIPANPEDRSPSPEPIYNTEGKRLNTREFRVRKNLEEERHSLIQEATDKNADYKPPIDYKPPSNRIQEKVMIPQDANPAINFIGLLIGPRGNTLKKMEKETGCKIIIRGKGSVKEGKVGRPGFPLPGENEPLHALVTGPSIEDVKNAVKVIENIIKEGVETPEGSNELRKMQLRELAALNGTLIEEDIVRCRNCGATDHRHWECTEVKNVTSQVICTKCGGYGHVAKDCVYSSEGSVATPQPSIVEKAKMDDEYMSLMAELGVDAPPGSSVKSMPITIKQDLPALALPPIERDPTTSSNKPSSSAPPPWKSEPKPLMSTPTSFSPRPPPQPLMASYPSSGPASSSAPWKARGSSQDQRPSDNYPNSPSSGSRGNAPPWSQQGSQQGSSPMGQSNNMRGPPINGSSGAPPPWQSAPPPWQQSPVSAYAPPPAGFNMLPPGVMYPQMGQAGPPIPPWTAPPPPPPPPSK